MEEFLEKFAFQQVGQDTLFLGIGQRVFAQAALLDPVAQPAPDGVILDVHVLDADVAAISLMQQVDHRMQGHRDPLPRPIDLKIVVEIGLAQLHVIETKLGGTALDQIERIKLGLLVSKPAIGADQGIDARLMQPALVPFDRAGPRRWWTRCALRDPRFGGCWQPSSNPAKKACHWASTAAGSRFHCW